MFCHQCQETMRNTACNAAKGVCGKSDEVSNLQDLVLYVCKGIGFWGTKALEKGIWREDAAMFVDRMLFATITNANFSAADFERWIGEGLRVREELRAAFAASGGSASGPVPGAAAWKAADPEAIRAAARAGLGGWAETKNEDIRALQSLVLYGLKGMAAYVEHAYVLDKSSKEVFAFMLRALAALTDEGLGAEALTALVLETGKFGVDAMALLDGANTGRYGSPRITKVKTGVRDRPGILVSGHDLRDLHDLLEQTKGSGVDVYTHGEMLPAHYYPFFEQYDNLYGNYGGAWWSQASEIESFGGPALFTSNCLVPPRESYKSRVFTTGVVGFEGCAHIPDRQPGGMKDFSAIVALARTCPPPKKLAEPAGFGGELVGGFGHDQVFALADKVVGAVKSGAIKRFVVMAGCDGRQGGRSYYTDVAKELPKDTVILTAGCAKYRYNKLALGDIGGIPRVLDAGQCNDSYSLALIALKLKEIFGLDDVNKLPLSFDIAWYEQKAVLVLLALLHLGVKNIRLGPTLPGFLSPAVAKVLVDSFGIKGIAAPEADVAAMMEGA
ncbi:MAG TPA: hydroxylamine reductase [Spirochaetales bacterium]|nr:hydroxylamine reductase [Spirochaetales bacterium]HRY55010.1 hydroxylamine reductase [Spirochaetia bacterium]HRZ63573.1 hydroxylamine reductase [Spirochaetia bacterium]